METMTPMDFLDFRDMPAPCLGFPELAVQIAGSQAGTEIRASLRPGILYIAAEGARDQKDQGRGKGKLLLEFVNAWLERMPFFGEADNWKNFRTSILIRPRRIHAIFRFHAIRRAFGIPGQPPASFLDGIPASLSAKFSRS